MSSERTTSPLASFLRRATVAGILVLTAIHATAQERIPFPRPDTHGRAWVESHGAEASMTMSDPGSAGRQCLTCHVKSDCISCHSTRPPRDHTHFWRLQGHGLAAGANRERCAACHRQDYCVRCHNETAPRTHTASWQTRHCGWCHYAAVNVPDDSCGVCHRFAPHASAPAGHVIMGPQIDCQACH